MADFAKSGKLAFETLWPVLDERSRLLLALAAAKSIG